MTLTILSEQLILRKVTAAAQELLPRHVTCQKFQNEDRASAVSGSAANSRAGFSQRERRLKVRAVSDGSVRSSGDKLALLMADLADALLNSGTPGSFELDSSSWARPRSSLQDRLYSAGTFTKGLERIANNALQPPIRYRAGAPAEQDEYLLRLLRGTPSGSRATASQQHTGQVSTLSNSLQPSRGTCDALGTVANDSVTRGYSNGPRGVASQRHLSQQHLSQQQPSQQQLSQAMPSQQVLHQQSTSISANNHGLHNRNDSPLEVGTAGRSHGTPDPTHIAPSLLQKQPQPVNHTAVSGADGHLRPLPPGHSTKFEPLLPQLKALVGEEPKLTQSMLLQQQQGNVILPADAGINDIPCEAKAQALPHLSGPYPETPALATPSLATDSSSAQLHPASAQSIPLHLQPVSRSLAAPVMSPQQTLGAEAFQAVRTVIVRQQDTFTEQLFGLHCASRRQAQQVATCVDTASYRRALIKERSRAQGTSNAANAAMASAPPAPCAAPPCPAAATGQHMLHSQTLNGLGPRSITDTTLFVQQPQPVEALGAVGTPAAHLLQEQSRLLQHQAQLIHQQQAAAQQLLALQHAQMHAVSQSSQPPPFPIAATAAVADPMAAWYAQHFVPGGVPTMAGCGGAQAPGMQVPALSVVPAVVQQMVSQQGHCPPLPAAVILPPPLPLPSAAPLMQPSDEKSRPHYQHPHPQAHLSVLANGGLPRRPAATEQLPSLSQPVRWWQDAPSIFGPLAKKPLQAASGNDFWKVPRPLHTGSGQLLLSPGGGPGEGPTLERHSATSRKRTHPTGGVFNGGCSTTASGRHILSSKRQLADCAAAVGKRAGRSTSRCAATTMGRKRSGRAGMANIRSYNISGRQLDDSPPAQLTSAADILLSFSGCG